jgi:hypothetical protein
MLTDSHWQALSACEGLLPTPKNLLKLSKVYGQDAAAWGFLQQELRGGAKAKFSHPESMIFTRAGLEMASSEAMCRLHANLLGSGPWLDATCGIGSDSLALARQDPEGLALDIDPEAVACATHNLSVAGLATDVRLWDCREVSWADRSVMVDPARRSGAKRIIQAEDYLPSLSEVVAKAKTAKSVIIKLSPLLADSLLNSLGGKIIFAGQGWNCSEALVLLGECGAPLPKVSGVEALTGSKLAATPLTKTREDALAFVAEAHPIVIRSHSLGALGGAGVGDSNGYLTFESIEGESQWLKIFPTLWQGPYRLPEIQKAIKRLALAVPVVKTRGVKLDPIHVQKQLKPGGTEPAFLFLFPVGAKIRAVLTGPRVFAQTTQAP